MDQDAPPVVIAQSFDEATSPVKAPIFVPPVPRCPKPEAGEIVVCVQDPETFRLRPLSDRYASDGSGDAVPRARLPLGEGTSVGAELERDGFDGRVSNRVMIRGRVKF